MYFQTCKVHVHVYYFMVHIMTFVGLLVFCSFSCFNPFADIKVKHKKNMEWTNYMHNYMHATIFLKCLRSKVNDSRISVWC